MHLKNYYQKDNTIFLFIYFEKQSTFKTKNYEQLNHTLHFKQKTKHLFNCLHISHNHFDFIKSQADTHDLSIVSFVESVSCCHSLYYLITYQNRFFFKKIQSKKSIATSHLAAFYSEYVLFNYRFCAFTS